MVHELRNLSAREIVKQVSESVREFQSVEIAQDDLTLSIVKYD
jgi:serine phosphatase RsbU (regulator of sigma subunit)